MLWGLRSPCVFGLALPADGRFHVLRFYEHYIYIHGAWIMWKSLDITWNWLKSVGKIIWICGKSLGITWHHVALFEIMLWNHVKLFRITRPCLKYIEIMFFWCQTNRNYCESCEIVWNRLMTNRLMKSLEITPAEEFKKTKLTPDRPQFPKVSIPSSAGCHGGKSFRFGLSLRGRSVTQASGAGSDRIWCSTRMHV